MAEAVADYFKYENWDLEAAVTEIAAKKFPFPVLQLQADSDSSQPATNFANAANAAKPLSSAVPATIYDLRNCRYGEVIAARQDFLRLNIKVYNTIGLNDFP